MSPDRRLHASNGVQGRSQFNTTHWSVVLNAAKSGTAEATAALEQLCQTYWYPLYAYVRRRGVNPHDGEDLVQGFFARLIEKSTLDGLERSGGRFRSFLLVSFNHFVSDERDRASRFKRGGGQEVLSLDAGKAEERYDLEPTDLLDPEKLFERRWALTVLERVLDRLKVELESDGQAALFARLQNLIVGERGEVRQAQIGAELGLTEGAIAVTVHRLRRRYRRLLQEEIASTVADPFEVEAELRHLLTVLRR